MKKGDPLEYARVGEDPDGWIWYEAVGLFRFSAPPFAVLAPVRRGDSFLDWTTFGLTMRLVLRPKDAPSGLASPLISDMSLLKQGTESIEDALRNLKATDDRYEVSWASGKTGRFPIASRQIDEHTLDIVNYFSYGGMWKLSHSIGHANPKKDFPEMATRIAASVDFICDADDCRKNVYFE